MSDRTRLPDCATGWHARCGDPDRCGCSCHELHHQLNATPPRLTVADALIAVHALHQPPRHGKTRRYCTECGMPWPCRTAELVAPVIRR